MIRQLHLFNNHWSLILTYPTFLIPFSTWLLIGYFRSIPRELEEAAIIDGCLGASVKPHSCIKRKLRA